MHGEQHPAEKTFLMLLFLASFQLVSGERVASGWPALLAGNKRRLNAIESFQTAVQPRLSGITS